MGALTWYLRGNHEHICTLHFTRINLNLPMSPDEPGVRFTSGLFILWEIWSGRSDLLLSSHQACGGIEPCVSHWSIRALQLNMSSLKQIYTLHYEFLDDLSRPKSPSIRETCASTTSTSESFTLRVYRPIFPEEPVGVHEGIGIVHSSR